MMQEDKELLLKDLCARIPYGVKISTPNIVGRQKEIRTLTAIHKFKINTSICGDNDGWDNIEDVKPYLRPMSSMTEEERDYLKVHINDDFVDYCCEHHLDDRGLISMNLALEAPDGMYKTE